MRYYVRNVVFVVMTVAEQGTSVETVPDDISGQQILLDDMAIVKPGSMLKSYVYIVYSKYCICTSD